MRRSSICRWLVQLWIRQSLPPFCRAYCRESGSEGVYPGLSACPRTSLPGRHGRCAGMLSGACRERSSPDCPYGRFAGGNLALGLASRVNGEAVSTKGTLVGIAVLSPVTDLTLSSATYDTRADADPFFTRPQVAELVHSYLGSADAKHPLASPLHGQLAGMPPVRIHVGDDEVLLGDSLRYAERAVPASVDARVDVWMGMPHGFPGSIGKLKAAAQALDAVGAFLTDRLRAQASP